MSRLIDKLQKADKGTLPPIGFGAARRAEVQSRMLLISSLATNETEGLEQRCAGADAVLIEPEKGRATPKNIQKAMETVNDTPWGAYLEDNGDKKAAALIEAGCDFLVFSAGNRISAVPQDDKTGKVLEVESSMDDSLLRTINVLPVDAALLTDSLEGNRALAWHRLMIIQHVSNLLTKPLMVRIPANMTDPEIKALWNAGVDGVVVPGAEAGTLSELRKIMDGLPARARQKTGKLDALLPRAAGGVESHQPVPDEEEEEDEQSSITICIFRDGNRVLVFEGFDQVKGMPFYRPVGGSIEFGETSRVVVESEVKEETGLTATDFKLLGVLESIFVYEGQNWHEIVFVYDGRFTDGSVYRRESMEIHEDNCDVMNAAWRDLDSFDENHRLGPKGMKTLLARMDSTKLNSFNFIIKPLSLRHMSQLPPVYNRTIIKKS